MDPNTHWPNAAAYVGDVDYFTTNPQAFVSANSGVFIDCAWETDTALGFLHASEDGFGYFAGAFLETPAGLLFTVDAPPGSVTESGMDATFELDNSESAVATATFTPTGSPVTSTLYGATFRTKVTEQSLVPVGSIEYSTGDTFVIDDEHCNAVSFENHTTRSQPKGPKAGRAPANDGPEGAIALKPGSRFNTTNVGATPDPEFPILTCPRGVRRQLRANPVVHDRRHRRPGHDRHGGERDRHVDRRVPADRFGLRGDRLHRRRRVRTRGRELSGRDDDRHGGRRHLLRAGRRIL